MFFLLYKLLNPITVDSVLCVQIKLYEYADHYFFLNCDIIRVLHTSTSIIRVHADTCTTNVPYKKYCFILNTSYLIHGYG